MVHMQHFQMAGDKTRPVRSNKTPQRASARIFHPRASVHTPWCPSGKCTTNSHILLQAKPLDAAKLCAFAVGVGCSLCGSVDSSHRGTANYSPHGTVGSSLSRYDRLFALSVREIICFVRPRGRYTKRHTGCGHKNGNSSELVS